MKNIHVIDYVTIFLLLPLFFLEVSRFFPQTGFFRSLPYWGGDDDEEGDSRKSGYLCFCSYITARPALCFACGTTS